MEHGVRGSPIPGNLAVRLPFSAHASLHVYRQGTTRRPSRRRAAALHDCGRCIDMCNVADVIAHEETCGGALVPAVPQT